MSDLVQNFETILKKRNTKQSLGLYKNVKIPKSVPEKPSDVIKIVASQLKAIQVSESTKHHKSVNKDLKPLKKSDFLCVNNLPIYGETSKQHTKKFDTQFVSDTQLMNVVENVEMIDKDIVMNEEFETSFRHKNTDMYNNFENVDKIEDKYNQDDKIQNVDFKYDDCKEGTNVNKQNNILDTNNLENDKEMVNLVDKTLEDIETSQILNRDIPHANQLNELKLRTPSPVLNVKKPKQKPKTPPPLVYNLDVFEKFETLALSIIENCDIDRIRHVINSQILGKELCVKMNADVELNVGPSPVRTVESAVQSETTSNLNTDIVKHDKNILNNVQKEDYGAAEHILLQIDTGPKCKEKNDLETDTNFLEDEILFSSDEENDYVNKAYENIPSTCALKSSFHEQSDVLDKTVYVGFQTASDRSIQVCTESLIKAKSILSDVATENLSLTDMVKLCDDNNKMTNACVVSKPIVDLNGNSSSGHNEKSSTVIVSTLSAIDKLKYSTYKWSEKHKVNSLYDSKDSHRTVKINRSLDCGPGEIKTILSEEAKGIGWEESTQTNINDELLLQELENIEMSLEEDKTNGQGNNALDFKRTSNKDITIPDDIPSKSKQVFENLDVDKDVPLSDMIPLILDATHTDFKTASNKQMSLSKEALLKSNTILQDIDSTNIEDLKTHNIRQNVPLSLSNDKGACNNISSIAHDLLSYKKGQFVGFKTGNNKEIKISNASLAKTKLVFKDIDSPNFKYPAKPVLDDGVNKPDQLNAIEAKQPKTTNIISDKRNNKDEGSVKDVFQRFKTAGNKKVTVSKEALAKTKSIFDGIDLFDVNTNNVKDTNPLSRSLIDTSEKLVEINNFPVGFVTASNKPVKISKQALLKSKQMFDDIDKDVTEKANNDFSHSPELSHSHDNFKKRNYPKNDPADYNKSKDERNPVKDRRFFDTTNKKNLVSTINTAVAFRGFETASNKAVTVSEKALLRSKKIFQDIDSVVIEKQQSAKKSIKPSEGLIKTTTPTKNIVNVPFSGFHTASNKKIDVSENALIKSKKIFDDMDSGSVKDNSNLREPCNPNGSVFKGFQTASNRKVSISEEALAKSKQLFQDIDMANLENQEKHPSSNPNTKLSEDISETETLPKNSFKTPFVGFHTASKKTISVSEKALIQSRKIFESLDSAITAQNDNVKDSDKASTFKGFQTGSNKNVRVSEEALAKTKEIFNGNIYLKNGTENNKGVKVKNDAKKSINEDDIMPCNTLGKSKSISHTYLLSDNTENKLKNITKPLNFNEEEIDTQLLNNFEESLHTEDFNRITPVKSKRSGSPILSCPRAKKRKKFETPYSQTISKKDIPVVIPKVKSKFTFDENYKKNITQKYTLKDLEKFSGETTIIIDKENLSFDRLLDFKFKGKRNDISTATVTINEISNIFKDSVNEKLIPDGWVENHLKLILWKLLSYEIKFTKLENICTTINVLNQLKYRYDRELYNAERPALRKIFERDDVSTKTMVLCVVEICVDGVKVTSITNPVSNVELLLTDGWYCIMATIDKMLSKLVYDGKIVVGTKIVTSGAELVNCENGMSPWENTTAVRLKLSGNSTRRARWDARLGYHGNAAVLSRLSHVKMDGGKVSKLRVFITRVYPALYVEKFEDGSTVTRSDRLELLHQMKYETERQVLMEKLYEEVEKEFQDQDTQDSEGYSDSGGKRVCWDSGTQIAKMMKKSNDPSEFRAQLTYSQTKLLEDHTARRREKLLQEIQNKLRDKIEKNGLTNARNIVPVLKIRVAGFDEKNQNIEVTKGMMSIWKPNDAILEIINEGAWIDVMNVMPTGVRYSEIQISAGRQSVFSRSNYKEPEIFTAYTKLLKRQCFTIKDLAQNPAMATDYNEIDTVGLVFLIDPALDDFDSTKQLFQNVYLADADKNMVCVNFWGGLKKFGFDNVLDTGQVVSCANLQKRAGNTRKNIPQYRVTEFSKFTKTPKNEIARSIVDELNKVFQSLDRRKFCEDCIVLKNNFAVFKYQNVDSTSPYRPNVSEYNISKNKLFIDSPLTRQNRFEDFNLTGLDFETTFKQTDTQDLSEEMLIRKKRVNEKINKLKRYGEPPPLSPIHIINKSKNALSNFKSPIISKENDTNLANRAVPENALLSKSEICAANINNTPQKMGISKASDNEPSPVLMNRTYVKCVNPVKLNFNVESNKSEAVDQFAEDFDGSPPLSLD